jgi:hypothetical protein
MNTIQIQIKHRLTEVVLFTAEIPSDTPSGLRTRVALEQATAAKAILRDADLRDANLGGANLGGANLGGANLIGANLIDANLIGANLRRANLSDANLSGADLRDANLRRANLGGADLSGADLRRANLGDADLIDADLIDANLSDANLIDANLSAIRDDMFAVLSAAPNEVQGLITALKDGKVDGSTYEGECACLVGTIANVRGKNYQELGDLHPDSTRPIEKFFFGISKGHTPENNPFSRLALEWAEEWVTANPAA